MTARADDFLVVGREASGVGCELAVQNHEEISHARVSIFIEHEGFQLCLTLIAAVARLMPYAAVRGVRANLLLLNLAKVVTWLLLSPGNCLISRSLPVFRSMYFYYWSCWR